VGPNHRSAVTLATAMPALSVGGRDAIAGIRRVVPENGTQLRDSVDWGRSSGKFQPPRGRDDRAAAGPPARVDSRHG